MHRDHRHTQDRSALRTGFPFSVTILITPQPLSTNYPITSFTMKKHTVLFVVFLSFVISIALHAELRKTIDMSKEWKFSRGNVDSAHAWSFDDKDWVIVDLPHTWNNRDGQDGGNDYYRGIGWYRKSLSLPHGVEGRRVFLKFNAANCQTVVYVNGARVGTHTGGYAAFVFDITPHIDKSKANVIAVRVDNSTLVVAPPLEADFTFFGGITRTVELLIANSITISPMYSGSSGVFVTQRNVSRNSATVSVAARVDNNESRAANILVTASIISREGMIVGTKTKAVSISANGTLTIDQTFIMKQPHLWDGITDPYLYHVLVAVKKNNVVIDEVKQLFGLRFYAVDPDSGFILNGRRYPLHGVAMHEDRRDKGRAISMADRKEDLDILMELGCTSLRLSHYQHDQYVYDECDKRGIVVWTEIPVINYIDTVAEVYAISAKQQLTELIRQNYNHPSVCFWGIFNEIDYKPGPNPAPLIVELNDLAHHMDSTRITTGAAMFDDRPQQWIPDAISWNKYFGWYVGKTQDFGPWLDKLHKLHPSTNIGISEYGVGANPQQHALVPAQPNPGGSVHPEEYQTIWHEQQWKEIVNRPFLYMTSIWIGFDFSSDGRREGSNPGVNDKGLVTQDRKIKKDAFYFYKAQWNPEPMVYITGRRFIERTDSSCEVKIYATTDSVQIRVNDQQYSSASSTDHIYRWMGVMLTPGKNTITATGFASGRVLSDTCTWTLITRGQ
jgi:beta-galactosidase